MNSKDILKSVGLGVFETSEAIKDNEKLLKEKEVIKKPTIFINKTDKELAIQSGLIPKTYIDCEFDIEEIRKSQRKQFNKAVRKFTVNQFEAYKNITTSIMADIIENRIPDQSYIIGAPNGFGKTNFANSCIIKLFTQGRICTPYVSLTDLAQIKVSNERRLLAGVTSNDWYRNKSIDTYYEDYVETFYSQLDDKVAIKKPINIINNFSWSEYMNSDVLFCYFTDVSSKVLESEILKAILNVRGTKGLPTIAMISTSLEPYKNDAMLAEYVWNEILSHGDDDVSFSKVKHISCYKDYKVSIKLE